MTVLYLSYICAYVEWYTRLYSFPKFGNDCNVTKTIQNTDINSVTKLSAGIMVSS